MRVRRAGGRRLCIIYVKLILISSVTSTGISTLVDNIILPPLPLSLHASVTSEEYSLLHRLNQVSIAKYQDMTALATTLNHQSQRLNDKCKLLCSSKSISSCRKAARGHVSSSTCSINGKVHEPTHRI